MLQELFFAIVVKVNISQQVALWKTQFSGFHHISEWLSEIKQRGINQRDLEHSLLRIKMISQPGDDICVNLIKPGQLIPISQ